MEILDGKALSEKLYEKYRRFVNHMQIYHSTKPHLGCILIGDNPASKTYVGNKQKACEKVGITSTLVELKETCTTEDVIKEVKKLNHTTDGYIIQLPVPKHIDMEEINKHILPGKDVDGFCAYNKGSMFDGGFIPATPYGILMLLKEYNIETIGKKCVILGRSDIVGMPMAQLMMHKKFGNSTVTVLHSASKNIKEECSQADIIISAMGQANYVTSDFIKEGAVVIDVGINAISDETKKRGYRIVGDVDFEGVKDKCSYITPVPGGVGPMTICGLITNTLLAYCNNHHYTENVENV